jgi:hypothetical protein
MKRERKKRKTYQKLASVSQALVIIAAAILQGACVVVMMVVPLQ